MKPPPKMTREILEKMYKDGKIIALQAYLLKCVMDWMDERGKDPTPLTYLEQEVGDTALTIVDEVKRLIAESQKVVN